MDLIRRQAVHADGVLLPDGPAGRWAFREPALQRAADLPPGLPKIVDGGIGPEHFDFCRAHAVETVVVGRALFGRADPRARAASSSLARRVRRQTAGSPSGLA
ncbi:MAG: hypothetical protein R3D59_09345 [Paracoccaceae bacterium]